MDYKPYLINWAIVSTGKKYGGLALGGILKRNVALLGKWFWRFPGGQNSLWAAVIRSKFRHGKTVGTQRTFFFPLSGAHGDLFRKFLPSFCPH